MSNPEIESQATAHGLQDLPDDVLTSIVLKLYPRDIINVILTCKKLNIVATNEQNVWRILCESRFGRYTELGRWMSEPDAQSSSSEGTSTNQGRLTGSITICSYR